MEVFWASQIDKTKVIFEAVKGYGPQFVKEWIKKCKQHLDCTKAELRKWEAWLLSGGVESMRAARHRISKGRVDTATPEYRTSASASFPIPFGISTLVAPQHRQHNQPEAVNRHQPQYRHTHDDGNLGLIDSITIPSQENEEKTSQGSVQDSAATNLRLRQDFLTILVDDFAEAHCTKDRDVAYGLSVESTIPLLAYNREHFYAQRIKGATEIVRGGKEDSNGESRLALPKELSLADMNWLFTSILRFKVKSFGRIVFKCAACQEEVHGKTQKLETLLHHYAASHTDASKWDTEWPILPIFFRIPDDSLSSGAQNPAVFKKKRKGSKQYIGRMASSTDLMNGHDHHTGACAESKQSQSSDSQSRKYNAKFEVLAEITKDVWSKISAIKGLRSPARACVVFHCVSKTFRQKERQELPLGVFLDFMIQHQDMHALRLLNGLACRVCPGSKRAKKYELGDLILHFRQNHAKQLTPLLQKSLEWHNSILAQPETRHLVPLPKLLKNRPQVFAMVSSTFPLIFAAGEDCATSKGVGSVIQKKLPAPINVRQLQDALQVARPATGAEHSAPSEPRYLGQSFYETPFHAPVAQEDAGELSPMARRPVPSFIRSDHGMSSGRPSFGYNVQETVPGRVPLMHRDNCNAQGLSTFITYAPAERDVTKSYPMYPSAAVPRPKVEYTHSIRQPRLQTASGVRYLPVHSQHPGRYGNAHDVWQVRDSRGDYFLHRPVQVVEPNATRNIEPYHSGEHGRNVHFTTPYHSGEPRAATHLAPEYEEYDPRIPFLPGGAPRDWH